MLKPGDPVKVSNVNFNGKLHGVVGRLVGFIDDKALVDYEHNDVQFRGLFPPGNYEEVWTDEKKCEEIYNMAMKAFLKHGPDKLGLTHGLFFQPAQADVCQMDCCCGIGAAVLGGRDSDFDYKLKYAINGIKELWPNGPTLVWREINEFARGFDKTVKDKDGQQESAEVIEKTIFGRTGRRLAKDLLELGFKVG